MNFRDPRRNGQWTFDPDGEGEATAETGEYLTVWKKIDGEWKVAAAESLGAPRPGGSRAQWAIRVGEMTKSSKSMCSSRLAAQVASPPPKKVANWK